MTLREATERSGRETHDIGPNAARSIGSDENEVRTRCVSIDLDDADQLDIIKAWRALDESGVDGIEGRVSSGGEGAHIRGWIDADAETVETIRYMAGDHARRTYMDRTHVLKPTNILFTHKGDQSAGEWRADPWEVADDLRRRSERFGPAGWSA